MVRVDEGELETCHRVRLVHFEGHDALLVHAHQLHDEICGSLRGVNGSRRERLVQPSGMV